MNLTGLADISFSAARRERELLLGRAATAFGRRPASRMGDGSLEPVRSCGGGRWNALACERSNGAQSALVDVAVKEEIHPYSFTLKGLAESTGVNGRYVRCGPAVNGKAAYVHRSTEAGRRFQKKCY